MNHQERDDQACHWHLPLHETLGILRGASHLGLRLPGSIPESHLSGPEKFGLPRRKILLYNTSTKRRCPKMGYPQSSILKGFSTINHPLQLDGDLHMCHCISECRMSPSWKRQKGSRATLHRESLSTVNANSKSFLGTSQFGRGNKMYLANLLILATSNIGVSKHLRENHGKPPKTMENNGFSWHGWAGHPQNMTLTSRKSMNGMNIEKIHHHRRLTYVNIQCSPQVVGELSDVGFTTRLSGGFHNGSAQISAKWMDFFRDKGLTNSPQRSGNHGI